MTHSKILNLKKTLTSLEQSYLKGIYSNDISLVDTCLDNHVDPFVCYTNVNELIACTNFIPITNYTYEEQAERNLDPFIYCINHLYFDMLTHLINKINYPSINLETALYYLIYRNSKNQTSTEKDKLNEIIVFVLSKIEKLSHYLGSIFMISCKNNFLPGVERCLLDGLNLSIHKDKAFEMMLEKYSFDVIQYFIEATNDNQLINDSLEKLLEQKEIIDGHLTYFLNKGASFEINPKKLLWLAIKNGHVNILKILKEKEFNIYGEDHYSIQCCLRFVCLPSLKFLISNGENVHCKNDMILKSSLKEAHIDILDYLLELDLLDYIVDFVNQHPSFLSNQESATWINKTKIITLKNDLELKLISKTANNKEVKQKL